MQVDLLVVTQEGGEGVVLDLLVELEREVEEQVPLRGVGWEEPCFVCIGHF